MDHYLCRPCTDAFNKKFHRFQDALSSFYERSRYYLLMFSKRRAQRHLNIWITLSAVRAKHSEENRNIAGLMLVKLGQYFWEKLWIKMQQKKAVQNCKGREKQTPKPINFILKIRHHSYYACGCISLPHKVLKALYKP